MPAKQLRSGWGLTTDLLTWHRFIYVTGIYIISSTSGNCRKFKTPWWFSHNSDVIISTMASQITSLTIVYSSAYSGAEQGKHQSSVSLAFVMGIHRSPVNCPHKGPVTRKRFPLDNVIMSKGKIATSNLLTVTLSLWFKKTNMEKYPDEIGICISVIGYRS